MKDEKLMKKKMKLIEQILKGGYDDKVVNEVFYESDNVNRRESAAEAEVDAIRELLRAKADEELNRARVSTQTAVFDQLAANSIGKQDQSYKDRIEVAKELKEKIREVADMNTMGNVKLGLGEAWFQGQGYDDDHIPCPHCSGKLMINKLKKKLYKRKVRRNAAKGKSAPRPPKFMRRKGDKNKPGPKKGGSKSTKQVEWMKFCKAVGKTPKMQGKPWNEVMKKASKLRNKGVTIDQIKSI